jgi:hypothetical protein
MLRKHGKKRVVERDGKQMTREEAIALDMWDEALDGDVRVREYIVNRLDGMPTQKNENVNWDVPKIITVEPDPADTEDIET